MIKTGYPRPCPIPGHPQDEDEPVLVTESAWSRLRAWHLHAPAERLPLPVIVLTWPAAWVLHAAHVPGHVVTYAAVAAAVACWLTWRRYERGSEHERLLPAEAALVTGGIGGWLAAAVTWGPLGWPGHLLTWIYLAGSIGGYCLAAPSRSRPRCPPAPRGRRRLDGPQSRMAPGRAPDRPGRLPPAEGHPDAARRGTPAHQRARQRPGLEGRAERDAIAEKYAHLEGLPYGRVDISTTDYPGQLVIGIRRADPSVKGIVYHPLTTPWPSAEPSPYAGWFPAGATIRDPVPVGIIPETGEPMTLTLFDEIGAKAIGVHGATGSGKSTLLNDVRERVTAMTDAALVQLNGAHMGDELTWEPLAAATACGPAASDEDVRDKIVAVLEWAQHLVTERSATLAQTGHSVFQPTPDDPAYVLMVDEVDEVVASVPGSGAILEFLASKQRKSAVCLILATQRATQKQTGGGMVRANLSQVVIGNTNRATESRHATGAEAEIPDISEYSRGRKGYFQIWDPQAKEITARGRTFLLGVPPDELAYCKRIVDARRGTRRVLPGPDLVLDAPRGHAPGERVPGEHAPGAAAPGVSEMRARLAAARERNEAAPGSAPARTGRSRRSPAYRHRPWRCCIRCSPPGAPQPQQQASGWECRKPRRTNTWQRCAITATPSSPGAAGPQAGSSPSSRRYRSTCRNGSVSTSPSASTRPSWSSLRPSTTARWTRTTTRGRSWRRSAASRPGSASRWSPTRPATESNQCFVR